MKTVQYIECWQAMDKLGRAYYYEVWQDVTFDTDCNVIATKTVHKGRCSKLDYNERMQRTKYLEKTETRILFEN